MITSELRFYSFGIVAEDKKRNTDRVYIIPIEVNFINPTKIKLQEEEASVTHNTLRGVDNVKTTVSNALPCRWLKFNSNRVVCPDVMAEDQVLIYRLGDTDIYYWQDLNTANVKRLETVTWAINADPNGKTKDDLSNAYWISWSSHDKHITIQTSKANGEPYAYTVQINTGDGNLTITDDVDNAYYIDSANTVVGMQNANGTYFKLDNNIMYGYAPDAMHFHAVNTVSFKTKDFKLTCDTYNAEASKSYTIKTSTYKLTCDSYTAEASGAYKIKCGNFECEAGDVKFKSPMSKFTGIVTCAGLAVGGGGSESACVVKGDMDVDGAVTITKSLTCPKITTDDLKAAKGNIAAFSHGGGKCC